MRAFNMKIKNLYLINILEEMASISLNKRINDELYDYYMFNDLEWLLDNAERIINDFYSNINRFSWELEHANEYFPVFGRTWGEDGAKGSEQWVKECLEEVKGEFKR